MIKIDYTISFDVDKIRSIIEPNDGYNWVYYDPLGMDKRLEENGKIFLSAYEKDTHNQIVLEIKNFPSTLWHRTENKDDPRATKVDAYGQPIVQETFFNLATRRQWVNNWRKKENYCANQIVECRTPEDEFMQQVFWKEAQEESFNKGFQRIFYIDIETEISETSLMPFKALDRINMITIYDNKTDRFHTWSLQKAKVIEDGKHILYDDFKDDEKELLKHFLNFWAENYPDVVCGWNSRWYDMPYIVRRIENVLGKAKARYISPLEDYRIVHEKDPKKRDDKGRPVEKEEIEYVDIKGMFQADALLLYRDKFKIKQALDGGYGLSNVGMAEGLGAKVSYETTLKDLYNQDWQKFYEYNVRDVDLLHDIEQQCNLIFNTRTIAGSGLANYDLIYQSTGYLVPTINIFALKHRPEIIFNTYANGFRKKVKFEGAWVIPPTPGRYSYGTATDDYNSLYPSGIRMMNLSIETYVGRILDGYDEELDENGEPKKGGMDNDWMRRGGIDGYPEDHVFKVLIDRCDIETPLEKEITAKQLKQLLQTKLIICPTNMSLILKHEVKRGVIADWCEEFYNRRKATKKEMFKCEKLLDQTTDENERRKLETRIGNLDSMQFSLKIALNSIYGSFGTTGCPFLHPLGIAQAVTRAGRFCNQNGVKFYKKWLQENYKIDDNYVVVASGDTDSCHFDTHIDVIEED